MPVYIVEIKKPVLPMRRLVRAATAPQAIRHLYHSLTAVKTATPDEVLDAIDEGMLIEDARKETAEPEGNGAEHYQHKSGCGAPASVPIGKSPCICTSLGLEKHPTAGLPGGS